MKKILIVITVIIVIVIAAVSVGPIMSNVEKPKYKILKTDENIQIRKYDSMIISKVQIKGDRKEAIKDGFRLLADYIFGNNKVKKEIPMTAPVQQQLGDGYWEISFIMPAKYKMETLPTPVNEVIKIKKVPEKTFVVIVFSGSSSSNNLIQNEKKLMDYVKDNNLLVIGKPIYAFYNPPWTIPAMRRNEVMFELAPESIHSLTK